MVLEELKSRVIAIISSDECEQKSRAWFVAVYVALRAANDLKYERDKPILIVCYTGHTASQINAILNLLGYNAWTLRFGMTSWYKKSPTAVWSSSVKQDIYGGGGNYPIEYCP